MEIRRRYFAASIVPDRSIDPYKPSMTDVSPEITRLFASVQAVFDAEDRVAAAYLPRLAPDFDPLSLLVHREEDLSRVLAHLLHPRGAHAQGTLFLEAFQEELKTCPCARSKTNDDPASDKMPADVPLLTERTSATTEHSLGDNGRVDILLRDGTGNAIAIENKPWAGDQKEQLERYAEWLKQKNFTRRLVVFLSNREPSEYSLPPGSEHRDCVVVMNFARLAECLRNAAHQARAPKVRDFVEGFADYLDRNLTDDYPMEDNLLLDTLAKPENLRAVQVVHDLYPRLLHRAWETFTETLTKQTEERYRGRLIFEATPPDTFDKPYALFALGYPEEGSGWKLAFEAEKSWLQKICWGVAFDDGRRIPPNDPIRTEIQQHLTSCFGSGNASKWWPWWRWGIATEELDENDPNAFPLTLSDQKWLAMMLEGKDNLLTQLFWAKVEKVFPRDREADWPKF